MAVNIADIIKQLEKSRARANKENIARYGAGLKELGGGRETLRGLYSQADDLSSIIGRQAAQDVNRGAQRGQAMGIQNLISSGLGNTTITGAMMRGVEEDRRRAMQGVEEQKAQQQMGLLTQQAGQEFGMSGTIADFMASRSDVGPDISQYGNLIQQAAAAGTGQPISTFGGMGPNARAGLDVFGRPMRGTGGGRAGGAGGGAGGGISVGGGAGSFGPSGRATAGYRGGGGLNLGSRGLGDTSLGAGAPRGAGGGAATPITDAMRQQAQGIITPAGGAGMQPGEEQADLGIPEIGKFGVSFGKPISGVGAAEKRKTPGQYATYGEYKKSTKRPVSAGYWSQVYKGGR